MATGMFEAQLPSAATLRSLRRLAGFRRWCAPPAIIERELALLARTRGQEQETVVPGLDARHDGFSSRRQRGETVKTRGYIHVPDAVKAECRSATPLHQLKPTTMGTLCGGARESAEFVRGRFVEWIRQHLHELSAAAHASHEHTGRGMIVVKYPNDALVLLYITRQQIAEQETEPEQTEALHFVNIYTPGKEFVLCMFSEGHEAVYIIEAVPADECDGQWVQRSDAPPASAQATSN